MPRSFFYFTKIMKKKEADKEQELPIEKIEKTEELEIIEKVEENDVVEKIEENIPEYIDGILKAFSAYETLYVNSKGGVFLEPYGDAKKYKNPHFNQ